MGFEFDVISKETLYLYLIWSTKLTFELKPYPRLIFVHFNYLWKGVLQVVMKVVQVEKEVSVGQFLSRKPIQGKLYPTRNLGALRALTSTWRPFGHLDFVHCAFRALSRVTHTPHG